MHQSTDVGEINENSQLELGKHKTVVKLKAVKR